MLAKDYVAKRIKEETDVVFGITGGAIVNLFDSLHKIGIKIQLCNHEQACAMAADAYAKLTGKLGATMTREIIFFNDIWALGQPKAAMFVPSM